MVDSKILRIGILPLFEDYGTHKGVEQCAKLKGQKRMHFIVDAIKAYDKDFFKAKLNLSNSEEFHKYLKGRASKYNTTVIGYVERCCIKHCHDTMDAVLPKKDGGYGF
jgi:hypothetical protein